MKKIIYILILFLFKMCSPAIGQISASIKVGYAFKSIQPIIVPTVDLKAHGLALSPEMIIYYRDNYPADLGIKASYEYVLRDELSLQAGAGRYFELYSTDKYDESKNGWANSLFLAIHFRKFVIEYSYLHGNNLAFGLDYEF